MRITRFYKFIKGYVRFSIENGFYERFINLCTGEKISLWDIEKNDKKIYAKTDIKGSEKIFELAVGFCGGCRDGVRVCGERERGRGQRRL